MTASAFILTLPGGAYTLPAGANSMVVWAEDATDAKAIAAARFGGEGNPWSEATATAVVAPADLTGYRFRVLITDNVTKAVVADVTHTGVASDTVDLVGDALVVLLNATTPIAGAAYSSATNVLTIAETTDGLGDNLVNVYAYGPVATYQDESVSAFWSTIVDEGVSGAALSAVLVAHSPPKVYGFFKAA